MAKQRYTTEEIIHKPRKADVLTGHRARWGCSADPPIDRGEGHGGILEIPVHQRGNISNLVPFSS